MVDRDDELVPYVSLECGKRKSANWSWLLHKKAGENQCLYTHGRVLFQSGTVCAYVRQTDRQTDRDRGRETDRQTEKERECVQVCVSEFVCVCVCVCV